VPPPEECSDEGLVDPPLSEEHLEHPVAEEMLQNVEVDLRKRNEPARWCEHPVGHQGVQVGVAVHQVPVGLDGDDDAGDGPRALAGGPEQGLQGVGGALAEFATNELDDQALLMLSLHLLQVSLVYVNTLMIQQVLAEPQWQGRLTAADLRALSPLKWQHVNPYGTFTLNLQERLRLA